MTTSAIRRLIRAAGREPVERDTLYNVVTGPEAPDEVASGLDASSRAASYVAAEAQNRYSCERRERCLSSEWTSSS